jgi:pimeloyl-ACP methyl ester carboxylesterase
MRWTHYLLAAISITAGFLFWRLGLSPYPLEDIYRSGFRQQLAASNNYVFTPVKENPSINNIRRAVHGYEVDGLQQYALVLIPAGASPAKGWPVLIFNHGYHPEPERYGITVDDRHDRPGDYYRGIPQVFAEAGYLVVTPDYRGHNRSEGLAYTRVALATHWYTRDVIAAYLALPSLEHVDITNVFMLGHSMGGIITLRATLILQDRVRAAAIWSASVSEDTVDTLRSIRLPRLRPETSLTGLKVPMQIHHALRDSTTAAMSSRQLATQLGSRADLHLIDSDEHLPSGSDFDQMVGDNLLWFGQHRSQ